MIFTRDQVFRFVFNLRTPMAVGEEVGTGIFVCKNNDELYLVTASHVAKSCNQNSDVVISDSIGHATALKLTSFSNSLQWIHHPVADLAVLRITPTNENTPHLAQRFFPYNQFNHSQIPASRDIELTAVGFPQGLGVQGLFSPLTYRSYASSAFLMLNRFDIQTPSVFFLLENPSVAGYSGCPIFDLGIMIVGGMTTTREKTICQGIMHGTIFDNTGGKLAAVTPSYYLSEII